MDTPAPKPPAKGLRRLQQSEFFLNAASSLAARYIRAVRASCKVIREPVDTDAHLLKYHPSIVAMWHGQFFLLPLTKPKTMPVHNMVAKHSDGEMIGRTLVRFDMGLIRGAGAGEKGKDRGGAGALRALLKAMRSNVTVAMTTDIPPGPARIAGMGIVTAARMSGRPIIPLAVATTRAFTLPTWSRFTVNLPFGKLAMVAGEPVWVPRDADEETMEALRQQVEAGMNAATDRAYQLAGSDSRKTAPKTAKAPPRRSGLMLSLYKAATAAARPAATMILRRRAARGKEIPERLPERLGIAAMPRPEGPLFWFHAASVGETNAVLPLMHELKQRYPALNILLTTVTVTSAQIAAERLPAGAIHQFVPLDNPLFCRRFIEHWRPDLGIFTESEIWPNLIVEASGHKVPLALVNARMSEKSYKRWSRLPSLCKPVFSRFDVVLTQNFRFAKRLRGLGARETAIAGNLKYDAPPPPVNASAAEELRRATGGRPVFLAASTHPGEDESIGRAAEILRSTIPSLLTVIAPRHPERGEAIACLLGARHSVARRSAGETIGAGTEVYLADTIGELGLFYKLSPLSFIGGSLVSHGGQNPIEAIKLGSGILSGPHTFNFAETYSTLMRYEGYKLVNGPEELAAALKRLFENPDEAEEMKRHAVAAIGTLGGALEKTLAALKPYLPAAHPPVSPAAHLAGHAA